MIVIAALVALTTLLFELFNKKKQLDLSSSSTAKIKTVSLVEKPKTVKYSLAKEESYFVAVNNSEIRYLTADQSAYVRLNRAGQEIARSKINFSPYIYSLSYNKNGSHALVKAEIESEKKPQEAASPSPLYGWYLLNLKNGNAERITSSVHALTWVGNSNILAASLNPQGTDIFISSIASPNDFKKIAVISRPINMLFAADSSPNISYGYGSRSEEEDGFLYLIDIARKKINLLLKKQPVPPLVSPKGSYALTANGNDKLSLVNLKGKTVDFTIKSASLPRQALFSPSEKYLALVTIEKDASPSINIVNIAQKKTVKKIAVAKLATVKLAFLSNKELIAAVNDKINIINLNLP